jgi:hypothetical protein
MVQRAGAKIMALSATALRPALAAQTFLVGTITDTRVAAFS